MRSNMWFAKFCLFSVILCFDISSVTSDFPTGDVYDYTPWATVGSWFLGPRAENSDTMKEMLEEIVDSVEKSRQDTFKFDKPYIDIEMSNCKNFKNEISQTKTELRKVLNDLKNSVPFHSLRYQGHMNFETTLPAQLGYFAAMLYNQNNVAAEGSPVTTGYEIEVGEQLCEMLGYSNDKDGLMGRKCWAHITSGGTVANIESGWAARNIKFFPIALSAMVKRNYAGECRNFKIKNIKGELKIFTELSHWELINLDLDLITDLYDNLNLHIARRRRLNEKEAQALRNTMDKQLEEETLQTRGFLSFKSHHDVIDKHMQPNILMSSTQHYSWPKMATILGLGGAAVERLPVDENVRLDLDELRKKLDRQLLNEQPVMMVVGVVGTTEESSVDPISDLVKLRDDYRKKGLNFWIHADGAWGGYYRTMLNIQRPTAIHDLANIENQYVPVFPLNSYTEAQVRALPECDSITLDPHKSGYIQYPAGALAYRNIDFRNFVTITAPVVFHGGTDPTVGIYGVEGSKPGAAPTAVLLSHRVIGLDHNGYGRILGQAMYGAKLFYLMWLTVAKDEDPFSCFPMKPLPRRCLDGPCTLDRVKQFTVENIIGKTNSYIFSNDKILDFLHEIGPDTSINAFACNYKPEGSYKMNTDINLANEYNDCLFEQLSYSNQNRNIKRVPLILTASKKDPKEFGKALSNFKSLMGLGNIHGKEKVNFLINTVMNPLQTSEGHIESLSESFREAALLCYGKATNPPGYHGFVVAGNIEQDGSFYGDHLSVLAEPMHQYQAIVNFKLAKEEQRREINRRLASNPKKPIIIVNKMHFDPTNRKILNFDKGVRLQDIVFQNGGKDDITYDIFHGFENVPKFNPFLKDIDIDTEDVLYFKHFEDTEKRKTMSQNLPADDVALQYLLYGSETQQFVSKINHGYFPDIHHIHKLRQDGVPFDKDDLKLGVLLKIMHPKYSHREARYLPAIKKNKNSAYCDDRQNSLHIDSCLTSLFPYNNFPNSTKLAYTVEYKQPFRDTKQSYIRPVKRAIYGDHDIWFDIEEINKDEAEPPLSCYENCISSGGFHCRSRCDGLDVIPSTHSEGIFSEGISNTYCSKEDGGTGFSDLGSAKASCSADENCVGVFNDCGWGTEFYHCKLPLNMKSSACGSILYLRNDAL